MEPVFSEGERRDAQLDAIFRAHVADLYHYIYRQVKHVAVAEDLTSAVFLKALRWLQQERSSESVKGWLYATARSGIADYWREQANMRFLPLEALDEMPALDDVSDERIRPLQARLQRLLDGLSPRERDVLTLRFLQGYSAAEIGQDLGLSANHVRVLQLRALRHAALFEAEEREVSMQLPTMAYNAQAVRVLELAKEEARALNHNYIGTEHVLLGILREGSGAPELIAQGLTFERIRGGLVFILGRRPEGIAEPEPGFTPRTKEVLVMAQAEAQRVGETAISPRHLFVAIMREGQGIAAKLLEVSGVHLERVGDSVRIVITPDIDEGPLTLPPDFQQALEQHPAARALFEKLSYTKKKGFVDRIEQAGDAAARSQQVAKAVELLQKIYQAHQQ